LNGHPPRRCTVGRPRSPEILSFLQVHLIATALRHILDADLINFSSGSGSAAALNHHRDLILSDPTPRSARAPKICDPIFCATWTSSSSSSPWVRSLESPTSGRHVAAPARDRALRGDGEQPRGSGQLLDRRVDRLRLRTLSAAQAREIRHEASLSGPAVLHRRASGRGADLPARRGLDHRQEIRDRSECHGMDPVHLGDCLAGGRSDDSLLGRQSTQSGVAGRCGTRAERRPPRPRHSAHLALGEDHRAARNRGSKYHPHVYLRWIDADNLSSIQSYRDQLGAWWLGWPIFAVFLVVPGIFMSIFSRKLPSKLVEETAAEILDQSGTLRGSQRFTVKKVGSIEFFPSMFRLISNKILIFNIVSAAFFFAALANFLSKENVFLETKFYAPRPNGILMGFGDPIVSRVIMAIMKPVLIGLAIVISGLVIARSKPQAKWLVCYTMAVIAAAAVIVFGFAFSGCTKVEIVSDPNVKVFDPLIFCNRNCHCSKDADFRPVCDSTGKYMYYSPCHAGCSSMRNDLNTRVYSNCSCAYEMTTIVQDQETIIDLSSFEVSEGACQLGSCQVGWILYEVFMALVYTAAGSTIIGDLLINLRTVNAQDKALTIGYTMALISFFAFVPIKILYDELTNLTCVHWGHDQRVCHLHDSTTLGYYLCFLTSGLLVIGILFKIGTWAFLENLELYEDEIDEPVATEMQVFSSPQEEPLLEADQVPEEPEQSNDNDNPRGNADVPDNSFKPVSILKKPDSSKGNGPIVEFQDIPQSSYSQVQIREEPVAAQDAASQSTNFLSDVERDAESSDDSPVMSKAPGPQVPYRPLDLDSDAESNCNDESAKKFVPVDDGHYYTNMRFPDPSDYEVPKKFKPRSSAGNFNEVGIPVVESYEPQESSVCVKSPTIMEAHIKHLQRNPSQELLDEARSIYKSSLKVDISESEDIPENHFRPIEVPPSSLLRPQSRDQASSGFGSLQDIRDKAKSPVVAPALSQESFCSVPPATNDELSFGSPLCTDL
ncbi:unnamed protein product, partial [Trichogramma brassicae]